MTLLLAGCSGSGEGPAQASSEQAKISVSLIDAPVDGLTEVNVEIGAIWIKPTDGAAFELPLTSAPMTIDLLESTPSNPALLIDGAVVPPGSYEWLAMDVNASFDNVYDSYVMTSAGGQEEIRVPSGRVRLVDGFDVGTNQSVEFLFDWDMRSGLVRPPGQPGYFLKPAFRVLEVNEYGTLGGTVAPETLAAMDNACDADAEDLDVGNVVYVFAGSDVVPDDIDGIDPDPVATAAVEPNGDGDYVYKVVLSPGDYTVAFTCQAGNDDPEVDETGTPDEIAFIDPTNVPITGDAAQLDF
jgi:hypothetical protein